MLCRVAVFTAILLSALTPTGHAAVWYVDKDNTGAEDGASWATAYTTVQPAIDAAYAAGGGEVWVAEGVYGESRISIVHPAPDDVNTGSLVLKEGVALYGGFIGIGPGGNETERTQRNWTTHVTTLDGSTAREGSPAYHVVVGAMSSTLDGFTITGGDARGGSDCATSLLSGGGGLFNKNLFMTISNCVFQENRATRGGGMCNFYASANIEDCTFSANAADGAIGCYKAAAVMNDTSNVSFSNCLFTENVGTGDGAVGGVQSMRGSTCHFDGCQFIRNRGQIGGAGNAYSSSVTYADCVFLENSGNHAAMYTVGATLLCSRCTFRGNISNWSLGGNTIYQYGSNCRYEYCTITLNSSYNGAVSFSGYSGSYSMIMVDSVISDNSGMMGGGFSIWQGTPAERIVLVNCTVANNSATSRGGGLLETGSTGANLVVANSIFWNNTPDGVVIDGTTVPDISYCDIEGGYPGTGNLSSDPLFLDISQRDYSLSSDSPCMDTGKNANTAELGNVTTDIDDVPRGYDGDGQGGITGDGSDYDMGAYEAGTPTPPVIEIAPSTPKTLDPLVCTITTPSVVHPGASAMYVYTWTSSGVTIAHGPKAELNDTLDPSYTHKHELWTCTVRAWDGILYSGPVATSVTVENTPPGPLTLSLPALAGTITNLRCNLDKSADPDGDVVYAVQWYVKHDGELAASPWGGPVITMDTFTQIDAADTEAGDFWHCEVAYGDGEVPDATVVSGTCEVLSHGTETSYISLGLSPMTVTLGESLTASGQLFPWPNPGANVFFSSTSPSGVVSASFPEGIVVSGNAYSRTFVPAEASEGRNAWKLKAWWPGDPQYMPAESNELEFTVLKAQPSLTIECSHASALLNLGNAEDFAVTAQFSVPGFPSELTLYAGRPVLLSVQTPEGATPYPWLSAETDANGAAVFTAAEGEFAEIVFDTPGVWKFKAKFDGDTNFHPTATDDFDTTTARLNIKEGAGYAIVCLGQLDAVREGQPEHAQTTDYIHSLLLERGFAEDDIYYMRDPGKNLYAPTKENLRIAIEMWARDKMLESPAPLYLIMVDHGSPGLFYLFRGADQDNTVSDTELAGWLEVLEGSLGAEYDQPIVVAYGACYSGSFIPALSGPNRLIVTSCAADEISYRGVLDAETGVRDGEYFLMEFFRNAGTGLSLRDSFELACLATYEYTNAKSSGDAEDIPQHPLLDDNGDGFGTSGLLSSLDGEDGALASVVDLGLGSNAANGVTWFAVSPPKMISAGDPLGELTAHTAGRPPQAGDEAWVEIKTPAYESGDLADPAYAQLQRVASMVGPIPAGSLNGTTFTWTDADLEAEGEGEVEGESLGFTGFDTPGTYKVYYFLRDGDTGQVGSYLVTNVYVAKANNLAPPPVTLMYPANGSTVFTRGYFAWQESLDLNGDTVTYQLEVSEDPAFPEADTRVWSTTETYFEVEDAGALDDLSTYYWRVIPVDEFGAHPDTHTVWTIHTDNHNPAVPGAVRGMVRNAATGSPIQNAVVTSIPWNQTATSGTDGTYFLGGLQQGAYTLQVTAPNYLASEIPQIIVNSGLVTVVNAALMSSVTNQAPVWDLLQAEAVAVGETLRFTVHADDPDDNTVEYSCDSLPNGAILDVDTGEFVWTPQPGDEGGHTVTFHVIDSGVPPLTGDMVVQITVYPAPLPASPHIEGPIWAVLGEVVELRFEDTGLQGPVVYHWYRDEVLLPGQTGSILRLDPVEYEHEGLYRAVADYGVPGASAEATYYLTVVEKLPVAGLAVLGLMVVLFVWAVWNTRKERTR